MRLLDRYVFKALTNQIAVEELESYLYQNHIINKIDSDELIFDLVNINYRKQTWRKDLRNVVNENYDETNILVHDLYFNCFRLLEITNEEKIYNIVNQLANLCIEFDYDHESLLEFYMFNERWDMLLDKVSNEKLSEIIIDIKDFSRKIVDNYITIKDASKLLNLSSDYTLKTSQEPDKKDIVDFLANKKINFESIKVLESTIKENYSKNEANDINLEAIEAIKSKLVRRIPIFSVVGVPLFIAGYKGIQKGNEGIIYVVFLFGFGLLMSAIMDIIQLIWYSRYK